jgi:hypothetical protein
MKYYVIESYTTDGTTFANAITTKDTYDEAVMVFHQVRASALANDSVKYNLTMVIDQSGAVIRLEHDDLPRE